MTKVREMPKRCTIKDVAAYANVATSTVSRVLNNHDADLHTTEETRRKILEAARLLNYAPNINAKRLFGKCSSIIALVIPSHKSHGKHVFDDRHLTRIFSGIESALSRSGYRLLIVFNDERFVQQREYLSLFRQGAVDGMLVWGAYADQTFWEELLENNYPVVMLSRSNFPLEHFSYVLHDYQTGGATALRYLLSHGHRQIAWLGGRQDNGTVQDMIKGFGQLPADCRLDSFYGSFSRRSGETMAKAALDANPDLTAVLATNTDIALGASEVFQKKKIRPEIVVCDTATSDEIQSFPHISVDDLKLGCESVQILLKQIANGAQAPIQKTLPVTLHESTTKHLR
jgi:DNA-binding LacI/PurR family transcriptional regulator